MISSNLTGVESLLTHGIGQQRDILVLRFAGTAVVLVQYDSSSWSTFRILQML